MSCASKSSPALSLQHVVEALRAVGIGRGSNLVLHSSLRDIGKLDGVPVREHPARLVGAILELIGEEGTLCAPAPNWDFGRKGLPFDVRRSPVEKEIGVLSGFLVTVGGRVRSRNPIFSVVAVGRLAGEICGGNTATAFGTGSPWERMFHADFANVLLGCDVASLTFVRFIEFRFGVPYLYNKLFETPVLDDGRRLEGAITAPVRFVSNSAEYDLSRFQSRLREAGMLEVAPLGASLVRQVRMSDCFALGTACLKEDIHFFLKGRPPYAPGSVPIA